MPVTCRKITFLAAAIILSAFAFGGTLPATGASLHAQAAVLQYRDTHPGEAVPVIVQTDATTNPAQLVRDNGGTITAELGIIQSIAAQVPADRINDLVSSQGVRWVSLDAPVVSTDGVNDSRSSSATNVFRQEVQADKAGNAGDLGQGVGVAVVDTGIFASNDFRSDGTTRVVATFAKDGTVGVDGYGHGTHVAGLVAGSGKQSDGQYAGVAPQANLISVKVGDNTGAASVSDVIVGLQYVLANKSAYNIRVVNLSLRVDSPQSYTTDPLDAAVELLTFRGILVVAAAGNTGSDSDAVSYAPANDPFILTVGALDDIGTTKISDDVVPSWSSRGTTQDEVEERIIVVQLELARVQSAETQRRAQDPAA